VTTWANPDAAALWRRTSAHREAYMAPATAALLDMAAVREGARVLAVGCGTGEEAFAAAARVGPTGEVVGTDLSAAMIDVAKDRAAEAGIPNAQFRVMDSQSLEFPPSEFDAVIARNSLMFVPDLHRALSEIGRVLRQSGRVSVTVWSTRALNPRISAPLAAARALGVIPPETCTYRIALRLSRSSVVSGALRQAGFRGVRVQRVALSAPYADLDEAVSAALEQSGTRELVSLLGPDGAERMRRSLARRWARYSTRSGTNLPGEQLVAAASVGA
jgi:ubiquinone/menaquinone biosynthesis C-methylase UbiE